MKASPSGQLQSVAPGWTFWAVESMVDESAHVVGWQIRLARAN
jgi:isoquinoline 1-oxidoreductase beta subunit